MTHVTLHTTRTKTSLVFNLSHVKGGKVFLANSDNQNITGFYHYCNNYTHSSIILYTCFMQKFVTKYSVPWTFMQMSWYNLRSRRSCEEKKNWHNVHRIAIISLTTFFLHNHTGNTVTVFYSALNLADYITAFYSDNTTFSAALWTIQPLIMYVFKAKCPTCTRSIQSREGQHCRNTISFQNRY